MKTAFKKILIANRGEIACRVMKTARRMGIRTVAVYSDADKDALHVELADEAIAIGPAPSAQSYLLAEKIISACKQSGAEAVHPGYGFLSENADFSAALEAAGIIFIGPNRRAIEVMGDKITSKKLAEEAGVNTIPGYTDVIEDTDQAVRLAADIGYPVMIKASAGGGGKGMRVAWNEQECRDGFARARSEAKSSFADDRVFLEKFIEQPRHIEIQIVADTRGNTLYLGERECSIQRRHQKVIEEAPSPFIDENTRRAMGEQAVVLAKAVDYVSAGTVEFIVDANRNFYFLEMNTRLQVEHPVTEKVTGLDLVELMLNVAAGQALPLQQSDVRLQGWAMECRIYAEDPYREFLPSIGRLVRYAPPAESANVRVDTGVYEGGEVSLYYDPMIAKLITCAGDRTNAIAYMATALDQYVINGVSHNLHFLQAIMAHQRFAAGELSTNFIAEEYPQGFNGGSLTDDIKQILLLTAAVLQSRQRLRQWIPTSQRLQWVVVMDGEHHPVSVEIIASEEKPEQFRIQIGQRESQPQCFFKPGESLLCLRLDGKEHYLQQQATASGFQLVHRGVKRDVSVLTPRAAELSRHMLEKKKPDTSRWLLSPMPGLLIHVAVKEGQEVKAGEELVIIEAMKMENVLRADRDAVVLRIPAAIGQSLAVDEAIIEFA